MPLSTTLEALHEAIQMTMGWTFSPLWEFEIDGRIYVIRRFASSPTSRLFTRRRGCGWEH